MAGVVAAVVSGRLDCDFIDRCFTQEELPTPLAPAEPFWLDRVQLQPKAQNWAASAAGLRRDAEQAEAFRHRMEREALCAARGPMEAFAAELAMLNASPREVP